ncbi:hypothetical protein BACCOP_03969 [Phocaeicola coprocola DSM 17136]|uniref:Lipoprotein n=1 Tax=Phocaeicola coprocola DSM 17136 TaxID=470145 RepID=B3JPT6_9BACT|nr:hypothetical protein BACCOP_03969 [Phocaeicola coprocola DSM 17136]
MESSRLFLLFIVYNYSLIGCKYTDYIEIIYSFCGLFCFILKLCKQNE